MIRGLFFVALIVAAAAGLGGHHDPDAPDASAAPASAPATASPASRPTKAAPHATPTPKHTAAPATHAPANSSRPADPTLTPGEVAAAYHVALQAIAAESADRSCADDIDAADGCDQFLGGFLGTMADATPRYQPGKFVGIEWRCDGPDNDACYAGEIWHSGRAILQTGP